jgi:hypothetical protein
MSLRDPAKSLIFYKGTVTQCSAPRHWNKLDKSKKHSALLQSMLDDACA